MALSIPQLVIVLLCMLGAGALVTVCAAFGKSMFGSRDEPTTDFNQRSPEQDSYLRRVREINQLAIWSQVRGQRKEQRRRDREASDIEIQSGRSYSNAGRYGNGGYSQHSGGYHGQGYNNHAQPVAYYEEEEYYAEYAASNMGPGEQPVSHQPEGQYSGGYNDARASNQSKMLSTETWSEIRR